MYMQISASSPEPAAEIAGTCLHMRVRLLSRVLSKLYDDALRPFGVKSSQFNILVAAGVIGQVSPRQLSRRLHLDLSTVSRNVERLRAAGWLEAMQADDGRARPFRLTEAGTALIEAALPAWRAAQQEAARLLGHAQRDALFQAVESIREQGTPTRAQRP